MSNEHQLDNLLARARVGDTSALGELLEQSPERRQLENGIAETVDVQKVHGRDGIQPSGHHAFTADPEELQLRARRCRGLKALHEAGPETVAGRFARDKANLQTAWFGQVGI